MKNQREQVKAAKRAYLLKLTKSHSPSRFAVYLDAGKGLTVLWPTGEDREKDFLPHQIFYKANSNKLPAYHFTVKGVNLNHFEEIKEVLTCINPKLEVFGLNGWAPTIRG